MHHQCCKCRDIAIYAICLIVCLSLVSRTCLWTKWHAWYLKWERKREADNADNWRLLGHLQLYTPTDAHRIANVGLHIVRKISWYETPWYIDWRFGLQYEHYYQCAWCLSLSVTWLNLASLCMGHLVQPLSDHFGHLLMFSRQTGT